MRAIYTSIKHKKHCARIGPFPTISMKKYFYLILLLTALTFGYTDTIIAQNITASPPVFKNQGEQENYWAEKFFAEKYQKQSYKRYKGDITLADKGRIYYDKTFITLHYTAPELKAIFTSGTIYPSLLGTDSSRITDVEQLMFMKTSPQVKRFRLWLFNSLTANPIVYFFELINNKATKETSTADFIKNAELTFIKEGWLII